jgi:hypothetical protein
MFGDDRFERSLFSESCGKFGAEDVEIGLCLGLFESLGFEHVAKLADFFADSGHALGHGFEFEGELSALAAERFDLKVGIGDFGLQTASFAIRAGEAFFSLS